MNLTGNNTRRGVEDTYDRTRGIPNQCKNVDKGRKMFHTEHFDEIIDIIKERLIAPLVGKLGKNMIMWTITMEIGVIMIIAGSSSTSSKHRRKRKQ